MMNRLNTISPSLKSKAIEETEAVSRELARRFYQAVCLDTPPETGIESRSIPTPPTPPAVLYKSPPTPTIPIDKLRNRANLRQSLSYHSLATPTTTPEPSSRKSKAIDRKVSFSNMASVILIPTVGEYVQAGLHHHIWWRSGELQEFRHNAHREIRSLMEIYGLKHIREAFNIMTRHESEDKNDDLVPANSHVNFPQDSAKFRGAVASQLSRVPFIRHNSRLAESLQALVAQQISPQPSPEPSLQINHC